MQLSAGQINVLHTKHCTEVIQTGSSTGCTGSTRKCHENKESSVSVFWYHDIQLNALYIYMCIIISGTEDDSEQEFERCDMEDDDDDDNSQYLKRGHSDVERYVWTEVNACNQVCVYSNALL